MALARVSDEPLATGRRSASPVVDGLIAVHRTKFAAPQLEFLLADGRLVGPRTLEATLPGVWAMGECAGSPQFTHVAFDDFRVVRGNLAGKARTTRDRLIPCCAFIDPELARVGLDESTAQQRRIAVRVARIPMSSVLRARAIGETRGFMKMLLAADSDRILGFTTLGADAGEVVAVVQTAMLAGLPYTGLRDAILTHPTKAEGLNVLLADVPLGGVGHPL